MKLTSENRQLMWKVCGWLPGGMMPDPDLIRWEEIDRMLTAAREEGRSEAGRTALSTSSVTKGEG